MSYEVIINEDGSKSIKSLTESEVIETQEQLESRLSSLDSNILSLEKARTIVVEKIALLNS